MHDSSSSLKASRFNRTLFWAVIFAAMGYYLWGWHREHVLQYWPIAIVFLCPLMHFFGHGGHGGGHHAHEREALR